MIETINRIALAFLINIALTFLVAIYAKMTNDNLEGWVHALISASSLIYSFTRKDSKS